MEPSDIELTGSKILIVDDTPANLRVLRQALEPEGYSILIATNGESALKIAQSAAPDLILLDIQMPGIDGYETCRRLKDNEDTRSIPIVFVTAQSETHAVVEGFKVGGVDYILKPFQNEEVLARARTHLKVSRLAQEVERAQQRVIEGLERELNAAHDLQMGLMPESDPDIEGIDVTGRCLPARHVGGDFFQYLRREHSLALCLADATDKGMEAAIPVVLFDGILESQSDSGLSPTGLFHRLNRILCRKLPDRTAICFAQVDISLEDRSLSLVNGGCPYPYLYRASRGQLLELQSSAYPLGIAADAEYTLVHDHLDTGDYLILCSDGVAEAENPAGEQFGYDRAFEAIQRACATACPAAGILEALFDTVGAFRGEADQSDDMTCVVVRLA